jgi:RNA recognition motif. (a.k.a. RRM, RBD, or RNP domain)
VKLLQTEVVLIENLPVNYSRLMLDELIKNYPGCQKVLEMDGAACRAVIEFDSPDNAKFAVMGLNRFIGD